MTKSATKSLLKGALLLGTGISTLAISSAAMAQDAGGDEVIVTGTRQVIQDAINLKRQETSIVDGLSASEIGDIPALSIGEALETLTSVAAQREGSGVTEVSIRGLGTFLGSTVINGREATNGSGNRSVNFSQFPSELFNKIAVYKTQEASLIEGGVSGQIHLTTLKPLDYGKRRIQVQVKGNVQPDNLNINDSARDVGHRLTGSFVDQFEFGDGQRLGISIGGQTRRTPIAEQEARSTSGFSSCIIADFDNGSCDSSGNRAQDIDPATGDRFGLTEPFVIESSTRSFRQQITDDHRDSVFGAIQWQPNERIDINLDAQYSERTFTEDRADILVDANDFPAVGSSTVIPGFEIATASDGSLRRGTTTGNVEHNSFFSERSEDYIGFGANASFDVNDRLNLSIDASYSETDRREEQIQARLRSESAVTAGLEVLQNGTEAHQFTLVNFDVTDPDSFDGNDANDFRVREDLNQFLEYKIQAIKADLSYDLDKSIFTELKAGARFSEQDFFAIPRIRRETDGGDDEFADTFNGEAIDFSTFGGIVGNACADDTFRESDFLNGEVNGNLFTNIDSSGNVIEAGTGNTFFTTRALCLAEAYLGREAAAPEFDGTRNTGTVDFDEETIAAYLQAGFETSFDGLPVRGNIGARLVNTTLNSTGLRSDLTVERDPDTLAITSIVEGELEEEVATNEYTEILPSLNLIVDVRDDILLRGAIFRGLSRPSPRELGFGRDFTVGTNEDGEDVTDIASFISNVNANGNPFIEPFLSWNFDAAVEWYPNPDTIIALGAYYKVFDGDQQTVSQPETFVVNGEEFTTNVEIRNVGEDSSKVYGFEATVSHAFDYLPGLWSGFGFKGSYNFADSDFESQDGTFGEVIQFDEDGNVTGTLSAIVPPVNLQGLSRHTASGQLYYNIGKLDLSGIVKHRSRYFQPGNSTPTLVRQIDTVTTVDARASYKLNDNIKISLEGTNLTNAARVHLNPTEDSLAEFNVYGPRYTLGLTAKF